MDPIGIAKALADVRGEAGEEGPQPIEILDTSPSSDSETSPSGGGTRIDDLFDDDAPALEPNHSIPPTQTRPVLDTPTPGTLPSMGSSTMS
jgi:hypothetical protein